MGILHNMGIRCNNSTISRNQSRTAGQIYNNNTALHRHWFLYMCLSVRSISLAVLCISFLPFVNGYTGAEIGIWFINFFRCLRAWDRLKVAALISVAAEVLVRVFLGFCALIGFWAGVSEVHRSGLPWVFESVLGDWNDERVSEEKVWCGCTDETLFYKRKIAKLELIFWLSYQGTKSSY